MRDVFDYLKVCSPCAPITSGGRWPDLQFALTTYLLRQVALVVKNLPANAGDMRDLNSISGSGRSSGKAKGNLLQYSCLEDPMDKGDSWTTVQRVSGTQQAQTLKHIPRCWSPLPLPQFGLKLNSREGTHSHTSAENWIKDLLSMALPTRARDSFIHSQLLPSGSFHSLLSFRGHTQ